MQIKIIEFQAKLKEITAGVKKKLNKFSYGPFDLQTAPGEVLYDIWLNDWRTVRGSKSCSYLTRQMKTFELIYFIIDFLTYVM